MASPDEALSPIKRALVELRDLRARLATVEAERREPIAIVGLGLRFPGGARDAESYWRLLREGRDAVTEVPQERWDRDAYFDPNSEAPRPGRMYTRHGAFLEDVDLFDPHFFGISPREAASMDPQQRLMLEVAWEALEGAGEAPDRLLGTATGVFIGAASMDYARMVFGDPSRIDVYASTGTALSVMAGRLSYLLGLEGPCLTVDTACSASLVAVHLACQSLRSGECGMALVGGVNLMLSPEIHINFCQARMLAADGRCKTFDAAADGYVRGEGCGVVVLKRLSDALASGSRILAVIPGSAVNQDGRSNGLTAPSGPAQEAVIRAALAGAGAKPEDVDYVEAHGTGTSLGDPIELRALGSVLGAGRSPDRPLLVGSTKTNIGHLEAAAGIAGLIKAVLALQHEEIPPHLHFHRGNPHLDWSVLPLRVPTSVTPWPRGPRRRLAGVSSFGFSGTNAHVLVEEAPLEPSPSAPPLHERPLHFLALSARSEAALRQSAGRLAEHLAAHPEMSLADVAFTEGAGRAQLPQRLSLAASTVDEARSGLEAHAAGQQSPAVITGMAPEARTPELAFLFTGSGAQYVGMGRQLFETQPTFRKALLDCDEILKDVLERRLLTVLYPEAGTASPIDEIAYTQPALFALQHALVVLWRSWGIEPAVVLGHSAGELVAACAAGVFSLEDGLRFSAERSRLMHALPRLGGMAAVFAPEARVEEAIAPHAGKLWIAAVNAADNVVISGEDGALESVLAAFGAEGVNGKRLAISNAFHSPLVEPMLEALEHAAAKATHRDAQVELVSNLTGALVRRGELGPAYWRRHVREAVRFGASIRTLADQGYQVFLEIGPHPTLLGMAQDALGSQAACLPSLRRTSTDWPTILESLGTLFARGVRVDFGGFDRDYRRRRVALPTYPFQRQRHWLEVAAPIPREVPAEAAARAAAFQSRQGPLDLSIASFPGKWEALARLTTAYEVAALRKLGAFSRAGESHSPESLRAELGIAETYRRLLGRWLEKLAADGFLESGAGAYSARAPLPSPGLESALARAEAAFADYPEMLGYVRRSGERLAEILTGRESPLETLFPGGSFAEAEGLYQHSSVSRYLNGIVAAAVEAFSRSRGGRLNVLEIGAGTGGTTAAVLPVLSRERTTYAFTDVSDLFLSRAAAKFAVFPFVRYGLLDMERDPQEQRYAAHAFDVVLASNVLHATRDLRLTLDRVLALLAPGGLLILSETTSHPHHFDITTGLIEGWQAFADDLRGDNPLISAPRWLELLQDRGFVSPAAFPPSDLATEVLGNHVILASARGDQGSTPVAAAASEQVASPAIARARANEDEAPDAALREELRESLPAERKRLLAELVRRQVSHILRLDAQHTPSLTARLMDLGLDSLMAVQLRNRLVTALSLGRPLSATLVFDHPTCEAIAAYLDHELFASGGETPSQASSAEARVTPAPDDSRVQEVEQMTDEETEAQLLERLQSLEERKR